MFLKTLFTLALGGGIGVPVVASLKKVFEVDLRPKVLRDSKTEIEIKWSNANEESSKKIASLINNLEKVLNKDENKPDTQQDIVILGVSLESSSYFEDKICETLGFAQGRTNNIEKPQDGNRRAVICETNLDRKEIIAKGQQ